MTLNKVVLPAPLGPMTATRSPAATLEAHAGERLHAAKGLGDVVHRKQRRGHGPHACGWRRCAAPGGVAIRALERPGAHHAASARRRRALPQSACGAGQCADDALRKEQHQGQDRRAEHRAPVLGVPRQRVLKPGQQGRAGDRSQQGLQPAEQHHHQCVDRTRYRQGFGRDAAFGERVKRSGQSCSKAREHESGPAHGAHVDADRGGAPRRVARRAQRVTERREYDPPQQGDRAAGDRQRQPVVGGARRQPWGRPDADQTVAAAGQGVPLVDGGPGDLGERERQHRKVDAREAHAEPAEDQRSDARRERRRDQRELHRHRPCRERRGIRAEAEVRGVAERGHAAGTHDEMQADGEQREYQHVAAEHQRVVVGNERRGRERCEQKGRGEREASSRRQLQIALLGDRGGGWRPAIQTPRSSDQHDRHHDEFRDQRQFRERYDRAEQRDIADADAKRPDYADDQRRHESAANAAEAADDGYDENIGDDRQVHIQIRRLARQLQRARESRKQRADEEHARKKPRRIDAERGGHVAILGRRTHQQTPARACQRERQGGQHERRERNQQQIVLRHRLAEDRDRAGKSRRTRPQQILSAPEWPAPHP